jgi:hypothetical protein
VHIPADAAPLPSVAALDDFRMTIYQLYSIMASCIQTPDMRQDIQPRLISTAQGMQIMCQWCSLWPHTNSPAAA